MQKLLGMAVVVVLAGAAWAAVTYDPATLTLTYGDPSDLARYVDPESELVNVQTDPVTLPTGTVLTNGGQFGGLLKADFNALEPYVISLNNAPDSGTQHPQYLQAYFNSAESVQLELPVAPTAYNWGAITSMGRSAFSGALARDALGAVETRGGTENCWLDVLSVKANSAYKRVTSIGFAVCGRPLDNNHLQSGPGQLIVTLNDGTTGTVDYPRFGGGYQETTGGPWLTYPLQYLFLQYTAPQGQYITNFRCTRPGAGNSYVAVDDLGFLVSDKMLPAHAADATWDGYVNVDDLGVLASNYDGTGRNWETGDFTADGVVNVDDLGVLASNYDWSYQFGTYNLPEPASLSLIGLGGLALLRRRAP